MAARRCRERSSTMRMADAQAALAATAPAATTTAPETAPIDSSDENSPILVAYMLFL